MAQVSQEERSKAMFSTGLDLEREGPGGGGKEGGASTSLGPDPLYVYSTAPAHTLGPAAPTQVRIYGSLIEVQFCPIEL